MPIRPLEFGCLLQSVTFPTPYEVRFHIPEGHCVDMAGCIAYALKINPDVVVIRTYSGRAVDTRYHVDANGDWIPTVA